MYRYSVFYSIEPSHNDNHPHTDTPEGSRESESSVSHSSFSADILIYTDNQSHWGSGAIRGPGNTNYHEFTDNQGRGIRCGLQKGGVVVYLAPRPWAMTASLRSLSGGSGGFQWPWQYHFPPFFTVQVNSDTRAKQLEAWCRLLLDYHRAHKSYVLDTSEAQSSPLFFNQDINRIPYNCFLILHSQLADLCIIRHFTNALGIH